MFQSEKAGKRNKIGALGEKIAEKYLRDYGFALVERNFLQKWGEIDLIMEKSGVIHFIEVKTNSYGTVLQLQDSYTNAYRPEEQLTIQKYQKLTRTIETWVYKESYPGEYQLDLVTVRLVEQEKYSEVEYFVNVCP